MIIEYTEEQKEVIQSNLEESVLHWFGQCLDKKYPHLGKASIFTNELRLGLGARNLVDIEFVVGPKNPKEFMLGVTVYNRDVLGNGPFVITKTFPINGLNYQTVIEDVVELLPSKK